MRKSLVALDTDHIKEYVFATDKLKEIRGASSILDYLNRIVMRKLARSLDPSEPFKRCIIYANGGSGLFLIDADKADNFGKEVQQAFRESTGGGASITYIVQELPEDSPEDIDAILKYPLAETLALMRYRLREAKNGSPDVIAHPSHPFMRPCDACGIEYATPEEEKVSRDPGEENELYCLSCQQKRRRDVRVKENIERIEANRPVTDEYLWVELLRSLHGMGYEILSSTERPHDFNVFRNFKGSKEYFGLIYADANGMGNKVDGCETLEGYSNLARKIDSAIYEAVCFAITEHLKIKDHMKPADELTGDLKNPVFPFDILLLGGDDVVMVVPATVALDVASTIAKKFYEEANKELEDEVKSDTERKLDDDLAEKYSLSVGVVLSPIKYPFGLLQDLAESTLKFAKKEGAKQRTSLANKSNYGKTYINFMTVTGSTSHEFDKVYTSLIDKKGRVNGNKVAFYATLRPYNIEQLADLLNAIRQGNKLNLGRTKLHQVREAVLKKNLTTSVGEGLAVLRNWRDRQRKFVVEQVYSLGGRYQMQYANPEHPGSMFYRVTFPWFADGKDTYRTSLLDFVELYDFVSREEADGDDKS